MCKRDKMKYKIAMVTPWFGKDLKGGARTISLATF